MTLATPALASGFLVPHEGRSSPAREWSVEALSVDVVARGPHALITVEQTFRNRTSRTLEADYLFALPPGAAISSLTLFEDGKGLEGRLLRAEDARQAFDEIVRRRKDPALLEAIGRDLFRVRVFPIPAGEARKVVLRYEQTVATDSGWSEWWVPLGTARHALAEGAQLTLVMDIQAERPIGVLYSPTHDVTIERLARERARVTYQGVLGADESDLGVYWGTADGPIGSSLLTWWPSHEDRGYFLYVASPTRSSSPASAPPKSLTFVVDTSGSMLGEKLEQVRAALRQAISDLNPTDRFNVIAYHTSVVPLWSAPREVDAQARAEALGFVTRLRAGGGTHIEGALTAALSAPPPDNMPAVIVFLTDGRPTMGETDMDRILAGVAKADPERKQRIFALGVGVDVNAVLLDRLAVGHRGVHLQVRPRENVERKVASLCDKIRYPVLGDLKFRAQGLEASETLPEVLPDLFHGGQVMVAGRYRGAGRVEIELAGRDGAIERVLRTTFWAPGPGEGLRSDFPARIWATRRIALLLDAIRLLGRQEPELVEEIVALSMRFGLLTEYTSFLADEGGVGAASRLENLRRAREALSSLAPRRIGGVGVAQSANQAQRRGADRAPSNAQGLYLATPDDRDMQSVPLRGVRQVANRTFWYRGPDTGWVEAAVEDPARVDEVIVRWTPRFYELMAGASIEENTRLAQEGPLVLVLGSRTVRIEDDGS